MEGEEGWEMLTEAGMLRCEVVVYVMISNTRIHAIAITIQFLEHHTPDENNTYQMNQITRLSNNP